MTYSVEVFSNVGTGRSQNEDNFFAFGKSRGHPQTDGFMSVSNDVSWPLLFLAADGLGGHVDGHLASKTAIDRISASFDINKPNFNLHEAIVVAHQDLSIQSHSKRAMGSTIVGCAIDKKEVLFFNVGDSRSYKIVGSNIIQTSIDDIKDVHSSVLTQCLGGGSRLQQPHFLRFKSNSAEIYLLLTDGVWATIAEEEILDVLVKLGGNAAERLCKRAGELGSEDVCTAIVIRPMA